MTHMFAYLFSPQWKEIMSFVKARIEHQSFIRKEQLHGCSIRANWHIIAAALARSHPSLWLCSQPLSVGPPFSHWRRKNLGCSFLLGVCLKWRNVIFSNSGILEISKVPSISNLVMNSENTTDSSCCSLGCVALKTSSSAEPRTESAVTVGPSSRKADRLERLLSTFRLFSLSFLSS